MVGKVKSLLSLSLIASSALGFQILATDAWLWSAATSHAYGLTLFAILSVVLAGVVWKKPKFAVVGILLLAVFELAAMTADMYIGAPAGVPQTDFRAYLLGDSAFSVLLWVQPIIIGISIVALRFQPTTTLHLRNNFLARKTNIATV